MAFGAMAQSDTPTRADSLRPGDKVSLRSGGPTMTVVDVSRESGSVFCRWKKKDGSMAEATFKAATLQVYPSQARPQAYPA